MKICTSCGRQLDDSMVFCDACGQRQHAMTIRPEPTRVRIRPLMVKPGPWLITVALMLVALVVGVGIGAAGFSRSQGVVTRTQSFTTISVSSIQAQDILEVCYSPGGSCASRLIYWIGQANVSIHVLIYSFTLDIVRDAIIQARNRGLDVKIVMDNQQAAGQGSEYGALKNASVDVRLDRRSADMHDKVAIIDSRIIISGSFNWSAAANNDNNENLLVIDNQRWATIYEAEFQRVWTSYTNP